MSAKRRVRTPHKPPPSRAGRLWPYPLWETPHPEEPAYGLLARVVERNLPGTLSARLFDLGAYGGHSVTKAATAEIARICGADQKALERSTPRVGPKYATVLGHRLRRDDFSAALRRWCPCCLSEHGCHLAWWDLVVVTSCPRHGVGLVDRCACGAVVRWKNQFTFGACDCGRRLADADATDLPPGEGAADRYVVGRMTGVARERVPFLDRLPLLDVVEVLRNVGHLAIDPQAGRRALENEVGFRRLLDAGHAGVARFPSSFQALLDRKLAEAVVPEGKFGAQRVYGTTFTVWLQKREPKSLSGAISAELRLHAGRNLTLNKRTLLGAAVDRKRVSMVEAAVICGIAFGRMKRILILRGLLPNGHGSRSESFDRSEIEEIASTLRHGLPLQDVARELGVFPKFMRSMIEAGHVKPSIPRGEAASWLMPADSATVVMDRLHAAVRPGESRGDGVPIPLASKSLGISMAELVSEVFAGTIRAVGVLPGETGLRSILIEVAGLRAVRRLATTETMTARDVARTFAVKEEDAIALLKAGAIDSAREGHMWMVDKASAEAFFRVHALLTPFSDRLRTSRKYLALRLEAAGIAPAFGPPVVGRKLFRRDDIEGYLAREGWPPKDWRVRHPLP